MRCRSYVYLLSLCAAGAVAFALAEQADAVVTVHNPAPQLAKNGPNMTEPGRNVFMYARCFACHGEYGFGGVGPRFRNDHFLGATDYVVAQILIGRKVMPSFAPTLSNEEIAAVASYIRTNWGNNFGPVAPAEVAKVRNAVFGMNQNNGRPQVSPTHQPQNAPTEPHKPLPPAKIYPPFKKYEGPNGQGSQNQ